MSPVEPTVGLLPADLLASYDSAGFEKRFSAYTEQLPAKLLPLQQGLAYSSYVSDEPFRVAVLAIQAEGEWLRIRASIFYSGIIAGCSCADDPTPIEPQRECCEVAFVIDRRNGVMSISLLE